MSNKIAKGEIFLHELSPRAFPGSCAGATEGLYKTLCAEGAENMSRVPFLFRPVFFGQRKENGTSSINQIPYFRAYGTTPLQSIHIP